MAIGNTKPSSRPKIKTDALTMGILTRRGVLAGVADPAARVANANEDAILVFPKGESLRVPLPPVPVLNRLASFLRPKGRSERGMVIANQRETAPRWGSSGWRSTVATNRSVW